MRGVVRHGVPGARGRASATCRTRIATVLLQIREPDRRRPAHLLRVDGGQPDLEHGPVPASPARARSRRSRARCCARPSRSRAAAHRARELSGGPPLRRRWRAGGRRARARAAPAPRRGRGSGRRRSRPDRRPCTAGRARSSRPAHGCSRPPRDAGPSRRHSQVDGTGAACFGIGEGTSPRSRWRGARPVGLSLKSEIARKVRGCTTPVPVQAAGGRSGSADRRQPWKSSGSTSSRKPAELLDLLLRILVLLLDRVVLRDPGVGEHRVRDEERRAHASGERDRIRRAAVERHVPLRGGEPQLGVERAVLDPGHLDAVDGGAEHDEQPLHEVMGERPRRLLAADRHRDGCGLLRADPDRNQRAGAGRRIQRCEQHDRLHLHVDRDAEHPHRDHGEPPDPGAEQRPRPA